MPNPGPGHSRLVYSTDVGRTCPGCRQPVAACTCRSAVAKPSADGPARVLLDTKGRRGKGVTLITGLPLDAAALALLGKRLKTACGVGGTVKDGAIELQGDQRDTVLAWLQKDGWATKKAGG